MAEFRLCYVEDQFAYFTTEELSEQWGDDWDDAPYEHNAGIPYPPTNTDEWKIKILAFDGPLYTPAYFAHVNSTYSVKMINAGAVAWLATDVHAKINVSIPAGATIDEFESLVSKAGGTVYFPKEPL